MHYQNLFTVHNTSSSAQRINNVYNSQDVVRKIEKTVTGANDRPIKDVVIANTHTEVVSEPFAVTKDNAQ